MIGIPGLSIPRRRRRAAAASYPLLNNLVAYWNLDEASGQRNDSHTNALHLTDNNTVGVASGGGPDGGDAADFEADSTEYLSRADEADLSAGDADFTIAAWVRIESKGSNRSFFSKANDAVSDTNIEYVVGFNTADRFRFAVGDGSSTNANVLSDTFGAPALNTWYFVVSWHDATADTINIAVNGGAADSTSYSAGSFDGVGPLIIGALYNNPTIVAPWDGRIAYVGFWKRTLTSAERTWLWNSGSGRDYAAVAAYTG